LIGAGYRILVFSQNGQILDDWKGWGRADGEFYWPSEIVIDEYGNFYVSDSDNNRIQKFDSNGNFLLSWGEYGSGVGQFDGPGGIAIGKDGRIYVVDNSNHRVQIFTSDGNYISEWGSYGNGEGQFSYPWGISVDSEGNIYVADCDNYRIQKFSPEGSFILSFGSEGDGPGEFNFPFSLAIDANDLIYVPDLYNYRIEIFDKFGNFISSWGEYGNEDWQFQRMGGIAIDKEGIVYVSDGFKIKKFTKEGKYLGSYGRFGYQEGEFGGPAGLGIGLEGSLYAVDSDNDRIQKLTMIPSGEILFSQEISISQDSKTSKTYTGESYSFEAIGNYILEGELKNYLGQVLCRNSSSFQIGMGGVKASIKSNKDVYKSSEMVEFTGAVENTGETSIQGIELVVEAKAHDLSIINIFKENFDLEPSQIHTFSVQWIPTMEGDFTATIRIITQNGEIANSSTLFKVAKPIVNASIEGPSIVGRDPFNIVLNLENKSIVPTEIQVSATGGNLNQIQTVQVPPMEKILIEFQQSIAEDTTFNFSLTGDWNEFLTKTVVFGLNLNISAALEPKYLIGNLEIPIKIENTGILDETFTIIYKILKDSIVIESKIKEYYIKAGTIKEDKVFFEGAEEGEYIFEILCSSPAISIKNNLYVVPEVKVETQTQIGSQMGTIIPITVSLQDLGIEPQSGEIIVEVKDLEGNNLWSSRQEFSSQEILREPLRQFIFNIETSFIPAGNYSIFVSVLDNANQILKLETMPLQIYDANIILTQIPNDLYFNSGEEGIFNFKIANTGGKETLAILKIQAQDLIQSQTREWLKPGEEKEILFNFLIPTDIESKNYYADYELIRDDTGKSIQKGKIVYKVEGMKINVNASLDKEIYNDGDLALLTLNIQSLEPLSESIELTAKVHYNEIDLNQNFNFSGSSSISFQIPLTKITGEYLFYGIYFNSGRALYLNSLYIRNEGEVLTIRSNKDRYLPGDTATFTITSNQPGKSGNLKLDFLGVEKTIDFSGFHSESYSIPEIVGSGTFDFSYVFTDTSGNIYLGNYQVDIEGIKIKMLNLNLDKEKYLPNDIIKARFEIECNKNLSAILKAYLIDPENRIIPLGEENVQLVSSNITIFDKSFYLSTSVSGIHKFFYGIYLDEDSPLLTGSKNFDVGDAVLLSIKPEQKEYPSHQNPINFIASTYGKGAATFELLIDGNPVYSNLLDLNGFKDVSISIVPPKPGKLEVLAKLIKDGLESKKTTEVLVGTSLPDLSVVISQKEKFDLDGNLVLEIIATNDGKMGAGAFNISFYVDGILKEVKNIDGIEKGGQKTVEFKLNVLGLAGEHNFSFLIDSEDQVLEFDETNNRAEKSTILQNLDLALETDQLTYQSNEQVNIMTSILNLSSIEYGNINLAIQIKDSSDNVLFDIANIFPNLLPASLQKYQTAWNTGSNPAGKYYIFSEILKDNDVLALEYMPFKIAETVSIVGSIKTQSSQANQGQPFDVYYSLKNNGNIPLSSIDILMEWVKKEDETVVLSDTQMISELSILEEKEGNFHIGSLEIQAGIYSINVKAFVEGKEFLLGSQIVEVLSPLIADKIISKEPRILVWLEKDKKEKINTNKVIATNVFQRINVQYFNIVTEESDFLNELRSGKYNIYLIMNPDKPLNGNHDEEIREKIYKGECIMALKWDKIEDNKIRDIFGVKNKGNFQKGSYTIQLFQTPITIESQVAVFGKPMKLEIVQSNVLTAGIITNEGTEWPGIVMNPYGNGVAIFANYDFGESADFVRTTIPYEDIIINFINYYKTLISPFVIPNGLLPIEINLQSLGGTFDLEIKEIVSPSFKILQALNNGEINGQTITWYKNIEENENEKILYFLGLQNLIETNNLITKINASTGGGYSPYKTIMMEIQVNETTTMILQNSITMLENLKVENKDKGKVQSIIEKINDIIERTILEKKDLEKNIFDLLWCVDKLMEIEGNTSQIRDEIDKVLLGFQRLWYWWE